MTATARAVSSTTRPIARRGATARTRGGRSGRATVGGGIGSVASRNPSRGSAAPPTAPPIDDDQEQSDCRRRGQPPRRPTGRDGPLANLQEPPVEQSAHLFGVGPERPAVGG